MNLPTAFVSRIHSQFPLEAEVIIDSLDREPISSIRFNPRKSSHIENTIPWSKTGVYQELRPNYTLDPAFHAGYYYVQESSSMFIEFALKYIQSQISLDKVLDLCAAPGGKSTIILDQLAENQFLVSNEILPSRNLVLRENLTKWGFPNFLVTENKPKDFAKIENYFDCILIDAPCSGEGLFRKDILARDEWSLQNAMMCAERQEDIFLYTWDSLKHGGYLIYSTCTYNPDENENLIIKLRKLGYEFESISLEIPDEWNINTVEVDRVYGYQFLPHRVKGEGFFCTILKKKGDWTASKSLHSKSSLNPWLRSYLDFDKLGNYSSFKFKNSLYLAPNRLLDELDYIKSHLYTKQIGIEIANFSGTNLEVNHGLAMLSTNSVFESPIDINKEEALAYLSKSELTLDTNEGLHLIRYLDLQLGWIKSVKGKMENLYPNSWKIRMAIN